ncbi:MAG: hypothetical protein IPM70_18825 [Proteobacteria bacterium]|nr:hypothetical protein [Pseudomonadota bacterium]
MYERKARQFSPDIVVLTVFDPDVTMTEQFLLRVAYQSIPVTDPETHAILSGSGLVNVDQGRVPIPYPRCARLHAKSALTPECPRVRPTGACAAQAFQLPFVPLNGSLPLFTQMEPVPLAAP